MSGARIYAKDTDAIRSAPYNEDKMAEEKAEAAVDVESPTATASPKKVRFHYIKSNNFRSIHADGVFGGPTPRGDISATFFNERRPLPDQTVQIVNEDGKLGDELMEERIERDGILRELEANIIMDLACAKSMVIWLQAKIESVEKALKEDKTEETPDDISEENKPDAVIG